EVELCDSTDADEFEPDFEDELPLWGQLCLMQRDLAEVERRICKYSAVLGQPGRSRNRLRWIAQQQRPLSVRARFAAELPVDNNNNHDHNNNTTNNNHINSNNKNNGFAVARDFVARSSAPLTEAGQHALLYPSEPSHAFYHHQQHKQQQQTTTSTINKQQQQQQQLNNNNNNNASRPLGVRHGQRCWPPRAAPCDARGTAPSAAAAAALAAAMADAPRYKTFGTALDRARSSTGAPRRSTVPEEGKSAEREQLPFSLSESDQLLSEGEPLHDLLASSASSLAQKARRAREAAAAAARGRAKARDRPAEGEGPTEEGPRAPPESESRPSAPPEAASEEGPRAPPESASRPSAPPEAASEEAPTEEALAARSERRVLEPPARARETVCQDPRARPVQPRLGGGGDFAAAGRSGRLEAPRVGDAVGDGGDAWRSLERQSRPLEAGAAAEPNQVPSPAADGGEGQFLKGEASPTEAEEAPPKEAKVLRSELKEERSPKVTRISADSESSESEESQAIELSEQESDESSEANFTSGADSLESPRRQPLASE
ncbi:unnamed protein product, partial [Polarella glacialis]